MRIATLHVIFAAGAIAAAAASSAAQSSSSSKKPPKIVTLSGCVERDEKIPDQYTLTDLQSGGTYRVSGKDFSEFVGRRVRLDGGVVVRGFAIKGGLQPNPNVAAQAGAIDPSRAAVQSGTGGGTRRPTTDELPEFRVKTIQTANGAACQ